MAHLLLIDDDPAVIPEQVRQAFPAPHRVEVASTGAAGLERARAKRPDVILLDLRLPDQSGLDVCDRSAITGPWDSSYVVFPERTIAGRDTIHFGD